jgi:hypothetical protein
MDTPEKLATLYTQDKNKARKHNAMSAGHHYAQANRNNLGKK